MSKNVFANGREISGKKDDNKSIAAMPDVCLSPPSPPAGPVPIPYPNNAEASDTTDGSKTVKIGGGEVGLKNSSSYKKSTGDEAATKSLGMGVVTHTIQDKMKHSAWSMDVKIEGQNAIRHMDMTTHNHMNCANLALQLNAAAQQMARTSGLNCEMLNFMNQVARTEVRVTNAAGEETGELATTTTSTAYRVDRMGGRFLKGASSDVAIPRNVRGGYATPIGDKQGPPCAGNRPMNTQSANHAESKILIPEMDSMSGGTILISTMHPTPQGGVDAMPCPTCKQTICDARACGIEVRLCRADGGEPPVDPQAAGLCPPAQGAQGNATWAAQGLGNWP
jgi:Domain of unknown function (DUF4150)